MMRKAPNGRRKFLATASLAAAAAARPLAAYGQAVDGARQVSRPSALQITELKCGYVRGSLFVKIHTNQGIWGCGEAVDAVGGTYTLVKTLGQRLRGQNPLNVHRLFEQLRKGSVFSGAQAGMFVAVLTALETALWTRRPSHAGDRRQPQLWGGVERSLRRLLDIDLSVADEGARQPVAYMRMA